MAKIKLNNNRDFLWWWRRWRLQFMQSWSLHFILGNIIHEPELNLIFFLLLLNWECFVLNPFYSFIVREFYIQYIEMFLSVNWLLLSRLFIILWKWYMVSSLNFIVKYHHMAFDINKFQQWNFSTLCFVIKTIASQYLWLYGIFSCKKRAMQDI